MNRIEGLVTFFLLVAIFVAAAGCSQNGGNNTVFPDGPDGITDTIDSPGDLAPDGTSLLTPDEGLTFDLIDSESWIEPEVLPESLHYFNYETDALEEGEVITWEADGGYFIDEDGSRRETITSGAGKLVGWQAPRGSGPDGVEIRASGPRGTGPETMNITVDPEADHSRTSQPYHSSLMLDNGNGGKMEIARGELLVSFLNPENMGATASVMESHSLTPLSLVDVEESIYRVSIDSGTDIEEARELLGANPNVAFAEYNHIHHLTMTIPDDPSWSSKWDLVRMNALTAWDTEVGSNDVIVAVIDTGVDLDHPDLAGHVINGADFVPSGDGFGGEMSGDGIDNNGNGWIDENVGHGTHCAGIIGAQGFNGIGTVGVNLNVQILPLRVFPVDGDGGASSSSIASAINYAVSNGAKVISLSLGSSYYSGTMHTAITNAVGNGVTVVCAAGNSNTETIFYPAGYAESIAVAAINNYESRSSFSNYGTWVDICAPGESIHSTYFNNAYAFMSGTSMACPEVAGVAALLWAYQPTYSVDDIRDALIEGADAAVYDSNPSYIGKLGSGCADMQGALDACALPGNIVGNNTDGPLQPIDETDGLPELIAGH